MYFFDYCGKDELVLDVSLGRIQWVKPVIVNLPPYPPCAPQMPSVSWSLSHVAVQFGFCIVFREREIVCVCIC